MMYCSHRARFSEKRKEIFYVSKSRSFLFKTSKPELSLKTLVFHLFLFQCSPLYALDVLTLKLTGEIIIIDREQFLCYIFYFFCLRILFVQIIIFTVLFLVSLDEYSCEYTFLFAAHGLIMINESRLCN